MTTKLDRYRTKTRNFSVAIVSHPLDGTSIHLTWVQNPQGPRVYCYASLHGFGLAITLLEAYASGGGYDKYAASLGSVWLQLQELLSCDPTHAAHSVSASTLDASGLTALERAGYTVTHVV